MPVLTVENLEQVISQGMDHWWEDFGYWLLSIFGCCPFVVLVPVFSHSHLLKGNKVGLLADGISPWQSFFLIILLGMG